ITGLPRARFDSTTSASRPSTKSRAPTAKRSASSLANSTAKAPAMPCGFPTRPTFTRSGDTLEMLDRVTARRSRAKVLGDELLAAGPVGRADVVNRALDVECSPAEAHTVGNDGPERGDVVLVRHADRT